MISTSSSISRITKSTRKINLSFLTQASSIIHLGYFMNLLANCILVLVGFDLPNPDLLNILYGMRFMLAPRSTNAL